MSAIAESAAMPTSTSRPLWKRVHWLPYLLAAPILVYEFVFILYPIYEGIKSSFFQQRNLGSPSTYVGLENYRRLWNDAFHNFFFGLTCVAILFQHINKLVVPVQFKESVLRIVWININL